MRKILVGIASLALIAGTALVGNATVIDTDAFTGDNTCTLGSDNLGTTDTAVKSWMSNTKGCWRLQNNQADWQLSTETDNDFISLAWENSGVSEDFKVEADIRLGSSTSASANAGLHIMKASSGGDGFFCKIERQNGGDHPEGLMSIGRIGGAGDNSLLSSYNWEGNPEQLTLGDTYHVSCRRESNNDIIMRVSGGGITAQSRTYSMTANDISTFGGNAKHGLRARYEEDGSGNTIEEEGASKWDNWNICSPISTC